MSTYLSLWFTIGVSRLGSTQHNSTQIFLCWKCCSTIYLLLIAQIKNSKSKIVFKIARIYQLIGTHYTRADWLAEGQPNLRVLIKTTLNPQQALRLRQYNYAIPAIKVLYKFVKRYIKSKVIDINSVREKNLNE